MRQSIIKVGVDDFLDIIKFNNEYHSIYNNILNNKIDITYEIFIYFILQAAYQNKFHGYFNELYEDVIKRKAYYIKELINNFKIAFFGKPTYYNKFIKFFYKKLSKSEIFFYRSISNLHLDEMIDDFFEEKNKETQIKFINFCELIHKQKMDTNLTLKVEPKVLKKVSFTLSNNK